MKKVFVLILFFFLPLIGYAQIVIEERVEIDPQIIQPYYPAPQYTPCGPYPGLLDIHNPRQAVWNGSSFWLDPFQQLFIFQQSGGYNLAQDHIYNIETTAGGEYFSITKLGGIDPITGEFIEPEVMGDTLLNVMGADLIGSGDWEITQCGTYQKENTPDYQCHFSKDAPQGTEVIVKITDITQGDPPNYFHTFIEIPSMIVDEGYTIYMPHYYSHNIDMWVYDPGNCSLGCGGHLPSWVTFTVEIVQGQEYGSIHNLLTDESADYFTNIETIDSWAGVSEIRWFEFVADGVQPDTSLPAHVIIRYTPSDMSVGIVEHNFYVEYNDVVPVEEGILVQFADSVIAPGDTTEIILKRQNSDGTVEDFSEYDGFEIGMIDGCEAGQILVGTTLDVYFEEVYQPIYFVADSNLMNTDTVKVRVGLIEGISTRPVKTGEEEKEIESKVIYEKRNITRKKLTKSKKEPEPLPMKPTTFCFIGEIDWTYMGDGAVVVKDEPVEILLGETKYFQAKYKDPLSNKLTIEEVIPGPNGVPQLNGGLTSDVWLNNPVSVVECDTCGQKMGVYWEKKYPTNNTEKVKIGGKTYRIVKMEVLSEGLIRLVGRYWSPDSTYIVKLKAKKDSDSTEIKIRVIQPGKLGDSGNSSRDVSNKPISIDSICMANGGLFGISPQIIKGHIANEAVGFWPSYAYEPYTTEFDYRDANNGYKILDKWLNHPFLVDSTSMGSGASVPNHFNVKYYNYISTPTKVWEIVKRYSTLVENSPPGGVTKYCKRASNDSLDFSRYGYSTVQSIYNNILSYFQGKTSRADSSDFNDARDSIITYLRDYWRGGLNNHWAQTRLASSYGHLQLLLKTAIEEGYPDSSTKPPEDLNINSIHWPLAMKRLSRFLNEKGLVGAASKEIKWPNGYEATFQRMLIGWNSRIYYSNEVLTNAKSYLPKK